MIINLDNKALKLPLGAATSTISFSTDATPAIQVPGNADPAVANKVVISNIAGWARGDFLSLEGAGAGGTVPYNNCIIGGPSNPFPASGSVSVDVTFPLAKTLVTGAVCSRYERFETRYFAKKVTLTNTSTGDVYVWDSTLLDDQAYKNGSTTAIPYNAILNRSNVIAIHPNLLPTTCNFTLKCDYDYYS